LVSRSHVRPRLMAIDGAKHVVEAARAAALAAHCAAGLAAAAGLQPAARLLRAAEALSRSAVASLTGPSPAPAAVASPIGSLAVPSARARRRRNNKKKKEESSESAMPMDLALAPAAMDGISKAACAAPPSVFSADAPEFVPGKTRTLKAQTSRERSPRRCLSPHAASSASALDGKVPGFVGPGGFTVGHTVLLKGLVSRPELSGSVSILSFDAVAERYAVKVDATGEFMKVKEVNLCAVPQGDAT
jgi:hypothetical protein